jgi:guanylate kinase
MSVSGSIFVVSGPSGAGKSTIIRLVKEAVSGLAYSVSHTSRKPRGSEIDGVDYHFVDSSTFAEMIEKGEFVEWAEVYAHHYGTSFASLEGPKSQGLDVILDVDVKGAANVKASFKESVLVYVLPPSMEELAKRLKNRGTDSDDAVRRKAEKSSRRNQELPVVRVPDLQRGVDGCGGSNEVADPCGAMSPFPSTSQSTKGI